MSDIWTEVPSDDMNKKLSERMPNIPCQPFLKQVRKCILGEREEGKKTTPYAIIILENNLLELVFYSLFGEINIQGELYMRNVAELYCSHSDLKG